MHRTPGTTRLFAASAALFVLRGAILGDLSLLSQVAPEVFPADQARLLQQKRLLPRA